MTDIGVEERRTMWQPNGHAKNNAHSIEVTEYKQCWLLEMIPTPQYISLYQTFFNFFSQYCAYWMPCLDWLFFED
jgi:hypothetical protein